MYRIEYTREALRKLRRLPKDVRDRIVSRIKRFAENPDNGGDVKRLVGRDAFRLRVGDWRVIFEIEDDQLLILVLTVGPRGEVYKR